MTKLTMLGQVEKAMADRPELFADDVYTAELAEIRAADARAPRPSPACPPGCTITPGHGWDDYDEEQGYYTRFHELLITDHVGVSVQEWSRRGVVEVGPAVLTLYADPPTDLTPTDAERVAADIIEGVRKARITGGAR